GALPVRPDAHLRRQDRVQGSHRVQGSDVPRGDHQEQRFALVPGGADPWSAALAPSAGAAGAGDHHAAGSDAERQPEEAEVKIPRLDSTRMVPMTKRIPQKMRKQATQKMRKQAMQKAMQKLRKTAQSLRMALQRMRKQDRQASQEKKRLVDPAELLVQLRAVDGGYRVDPTYAILDNSPHKIRSEIASRG